MEICGSATGMGLLARDLARSVLVDADEQEQPHDIDEVPVPGGSLEAEMPLRRELAGAGSEPADGQEAGADDDVEAVEAGGQEEHRRKDSAAVERERRVGIFDPLAQREAQAEQDGRTEALEQALAVAFQQAVMRPGH